MKGTGGFKLRADLLYCWAMKSCWHGNLRCWSGRNRVVSCLFFFSFFPCIAADIKCWCKVLGGVIKWMYKKNNTDLLYDTVQSLWAADVKADENCIWIGVRQWPHIVIIWGTCGYTITYGIRSWCFLRNSSKYLFLTRFNSKRVFIATIWLTLSIRNTLPGRWSKGH